MATFIPGKSPVVGCKDCSSFSRIILQASKGAFEDIDGSPIL
jgi:hypothetical protein